jgi:hypothetical protein
MGIAALLGACGDDSSSGPGDSSLPAAAATSATGGISKNTSDTAAAPATGGGDTAPDLGSIVDRKIIFNSTLALGVEDVGAAFNEATRLARVNGGYIERSNFANATGTNDKSRGSATLTIRVPAERYDDLLASLRTMPGAKVQREGAKSSEVTEQYIDLQSRLHNLQSTEAQYLKLLDQTKSINDILTVNDRLNSVRAQIEQIQGRVNALDKLTDLATVDVTLSPVVAARSDGDSTTLGDVWNASWERSFDVARALAAAGVVASVAAIWLAAPALIVVFALRRARRHATARPAEPAA